MGTEGGQEEEEEEEEAREKTKQQFFFIKIWQEIGNKEEVEKQETG